MKPFQITWKVEESLEGQLLREFLLKEKAISRQALTDIKFNGGSIYVNGQPVTVRHVLHNGDNVTVQFPLEEVSEHMAPEEMQLSILYEDDHFLVVNKPPNVTTIPSKYQNTGSLAQGVLHYYQSKNIGATIHIVNRLDRDTSGIVLIAKHRYAHSLLSLQQQSSQLTRTYSALCEGHPIREKSTIEEPIGRKEGSIIERCVRKDGQFALTHYEVLKKYTDFSFIRLNLDTGRTHQIRVHMAHIGHPLLGDDLYGGSTEKMQRQALHSTTLTFHHPFLEKEMTLMAPLPDDFLQLLQRGE
ncbi:RluA family pseudouridine synthase [Alkalihalobacillus sp. AL-G]|uniref:RluA family pseudouridine synthase n=1 Tax=Alkalihalobacillus sp. AL-G TaxID=2926399 RepID=UPI00272A86DD|nr:RluA family pseudouridine synthase [Alkalihalobacillus sp. AL-G]WLD94930.1 RluA family pseudouridine synthase [Alkalihalobacillus sp. AL-G]